MGAVLSLPLLPVSILGSWISSCIGVSVCSCCMSKNVNPLLQTFKSSIATRIMYAAIFMLNSLLSWMAMSNSITKLAEKLTWGLFKFGNHYCQDEKSCIGFTSVQRINFSLGVLHLVLAGLLVGVNSTRNPRSVIQNGYWMTKLIALTTFIVVSYLIPDRFFVIWGNYFSTTFSTMFIGIGLILLVDFAHEWAETCIEKIEEGEITLYGDDDYYEDGEVIGCCRFDLQGPSFWKKVLIGGTLSMYTGVIVMTTLMYMYFAQEGCSMNKFVITMNVIFTLLITGFSITPMVQEYNPNAGLAQSSMCCVYCTYLIFSACLSEPDDKMCNPLIRSGGTRTLTVIVGAIFTFGAIAYTTTRAAANSAFNHSSSGGGDGDFASLPQYNEIQVLTRAPRNLGKKSMRYEALRQAVNEGSLPQSALDEYVSEGEEGDGEYGVTPGEEYSATKYSYVLFHIIFFLATQYIAALLTINVDVGASGGGAGDAFVPVGRTYFNTWLKVVSSWVCYALYGWTLVAPAVFPDRFGH